jgi:hypothetical protein
VSLSHEGSLSSRAARVELEGDVPGPHQSAEQVG